MRTAFVAFASVVAITNLVACSAASTEEAAGDVALAEGTTQEVVATSEDALTPLPTLPSSFARTAQGAGPVSIAFRYADGSRNQGTYFMDTGIRCVRFPCPSTDEGTFRVTSNRRTGAVVALQGTLGDGRPSRSTFRIEEGAEGLRLVATGGIGEVGEPVVLDAQPQCVITGCSGTVCADQDVITTCEYKPEYACYAKVGICARNGAGQCGWAPTKSLSACLANPGGCK